MLLETHKCPGLKEKLEQDRQHLTKKLEYIPPKKLEPI
jgi:hypothetical protein